MPDMTVEEATKYLKKRVSEYTSVPYEEYMSPTDEEAVRVVLDRLEELEEQGGGFEDDQTRKRRAD